mgnify:FL=1
MLELHQLAQQLCVLDIDLFDLEDLLLHRFVLLEQGLLLGIAEEWFDLFGFAIRHGRFDACGEHSNALRAVLCVHLSTKLQFETIYFDRVSVFPGKARSFSCWDLAQVC